MRILIAPDKFKGCLTAREVASHIEAGFRKVIPDLECRTIPLADGGEGTVDLFLEARDGERITIPASDPLGRRVSVDYAWFAGEAVIEMSSASGLWRLADSERDPTRTSTRGTGEAIADAIHRGARRVLVGLGGSATNDAGAGLAAALGFQFLDASGHAVDPIPLHFDRIARIVPPSTKPSAEIIALSDVTNPLLGPRGATRIYGPQKGARDLDELEAQLAVFAELVTRDLGCDFREAPGSGAAGGLGFGILSFLGGAIRPGFDACMELLDIRSHVEASDLVITAEGRLDATTGEGKGPGGIARLARELHRPVIAFAGAIEAHDELHRTFDACIPIAPRPITLEESVANAGILLSHAAERVARILSLSQSL